MSKRKKSSSQTSAMGNQFVQFAVIGFGLYYLAMILRLPFEKLAFLVLIIGSALKTSEKNYNPGFSEHLPHNLTDDQIKVIKAFIASRERLKSESKETKKRAMDDLHKFSVKSMDNLHELAMKELKSEEEESDDSYESGNESDGTL
eukprot:snap_masked-scaffold_6-processed-gene-15.60-mRNA-1 protein AED:1.00 eAED:1.00 QI:0/-1/0/0/-1/1/1/0/145